MRELQLQDAFDVVRLIKKSGMKQVLQEVLIEGRKSNASAEEIGIKVLMSLMDAAGDEAMQKEVYALLGSITELGDEAIKTISLDGFADILKQFKEKNNLKSFFAAVKALMK